MRRSRPEVQSVTAARSGLTEDVSARTRRYLVTMGVRTGCLFAAVVASGPLRWVFLAGAVLLPWFAVVAANAGRRRTPVEQPTSVLPAERPALTPGHAPRPGADA